MPSNRKIIAYQVADSCSICGSCQGDHGFNGTHEIPIQNLPCGDRQDDVARGHGTHIAGVAVGAVHDLSVSTASADHARSFNALASGAKLFFSDIGVGERFEVPLDIADALFSPAYAAGARIHLDAWGWVYVISYG